MTNLKGAGGGLSDDPIVGATDLELEPMTASAESRQLELSMSALDRERVAIEQQEQAMTADERRIDLQAHRNA